MGVLSGLVKVILCGTFLLSGVCKLTPKVRRQSCQVRRNQSLMSAVGGCRVLSCLLCVPSARRWALLLILSFNLPSSRRRSWVHGCTVWCGAKRSNESVSNISVRPKEQQGAARVDSSRSRTAAAAAAVYHRTGFYRVAARDI